MKLDVFLSYCYELALKYLSLFKSKTLELLDDQAVFVYKVNAISL